MRIGTTRFKKGSIPWNKGMKGFLAGKKHYLFGKHIPLESRIKMREARLGKIPVNKGKPGLRGKYHPQWKGGKYKTERDFFKNKLEYKLWRTAVFERDNYTCIWCGRKGGNLEADHIKPFVYFPELRLAIDNGRTLCVDCHKTTDTWGKKVYKYGKTN